MWQQKIVEECNDVTFAKVDVDENEASTLLYVILCTR